MMKRGDLPLDVRRFVQRRIQDVEQLEMLIVLQRESSRFWDAITLAQRLHLPERQVADALEALARGGLLDVRIASEVVYRFSPATPAIALEVKQLADAYSQNRGGLLAVLASSRRRSLKDFSDAFSLTDDPGDHG